MTRRRILHDIKLDKIAAVDLPCQEGAKATITKRAGANPGTEPDSEGETMSAALKKALGLADTATDAEVEAAVTKRAEDLAKAEGERDRLAKVATMSDETRAHFEGLEKADKAKGEAFLNMSEEDRKKEVAKLAAGDETITVEGQSISKRAVGETMFAVMKAQAARIEKNEADIRKAEDDRKTSEFSKRASTDYAHLAGTVEERTAVLKYLDAAPEDVKKAATAIFEAAEKLSKSAFSKIGGHGGENGGERRDAQEQLDKAANDLVKKSTTPLTFAKAMSQVLETPEGARLYEQTLSAPVGE